MSWKLQATLPKRVGADVDSGRIAQLVAKLKSAAELHSRGEPHLVIEHQGPVIVAWTMRNDQLETVRRELDAVLAEADLSAEVTVAHRRAGDRGVADHPRALSRAPCSARRPAPPRQDHALVEP